MRLLPTVALVGVEEEVSPPGSPKKKAATSGVLAEPPQPAPGQQSSGTRSSQGADCRADSGSADELARQPWGSARPPDEPSGARVFPQSETTPALPARQTIAGCPPPGGADRAEDR